MNTAFIKQRAKARLNGKWEQAIIAILITFVVFAVIDFVYGDQYFTDSFIVFALRILCQAPVILGMSIVFLSISRDQNPRGTEVFEGFKHLWAAFKLQFLMVFMIAFWTIFLVIPGIMAALSWSMSFFILADEPSMGAWQTMKQSKTIMRGHRWQLCKLILSFIGWFALSVLTCGILFVLYVGPYFQASMAEFYESLQEVSDY